MNALVALDPAGPFASPLSNLSWLLIWSMIAVLLVVIAVTAFALFGPEKIRRGLAKRWIVIAGGLAFPVLVLSTLFVISIPATNVATARPAAGDLRVRVSGEMWWWRVHYLDGDRVLFETANEIRIPVGRPVAFELTSADVIHSFWIPQLGGKMDMAPGRTNTLRLQADAAGVYRGQCAEFCGAGHALMALEVIATSSADFDAWAEAQARPQSSEHAGWDVFASSGCGACHTVRGTPANGRIGPDLTHVASRQKLAAAILTNDPQMLRRFITRAGKLKPGVRMPDYDSIPEADIEQIAHYVESLR